MTDSVSSTAGALASLEGRRAVVTGGASGIGAAIVRLLLSGGARVGILDVDPETPAKAAAQPGADALVVDVRRTDEVAAALADHLAGDPLDVLVNCAGNIDCAVLFDEVDGDSWTEIMDLHVRAPLGVARLARPALATSGRGRVINISSVGVVHPVERMVGYCSAKGAVEAMTRALALELSPDRISVNCVRPSGTDTPGSAALGASEVFQGREIERPVEDLRYLTGEWATPDQIARVAYFLASDLSEFVNGEVITVDGGYSVG